jgi:hypothetical protein
LALEVSGAESRGGWNERTEIHGGLAADVAPAGGRHSGVGAGRVLRCCGCGGVAVLPRALGYAHQLPPADATAAHAAHAEGGHQPDPDGGAAGSHLGDAYFATLLLLLFGTSLLLGGISVGAKLPAPASWMGGHKVRKLHPPRGPTSSCLQVFRL